MTIAKKPSRMSISIQIILILAICGALIILSIILGVFKTSSSSREVIYRVASSGGQVIITYTQENGKQTDVLDATTPWEKRFTFEKGSEIYLTVGNPTQVGTVQCTITIDGREWKKDKSNSPNDKVVCAGIIP